MCFCYKEPWWLLQLTLASATIVAGLAKGWVAGAAGSAVELQVVLVVATLLADATTEGEYSCKLWRWLLQVMPMATNIVIQTLLFWESRVLLLRMAGVVRWSCYLGNRSYKRL
jgi:hypothetical protein